MFVHDELRTATVFHQTFDPCSSMPYQQVNTQGFGALFPTTQRRLPPIPHRAAA